MRPEDTSVPQRASGGFGYFSALLVAILTVVTFAIAVFTPPISGPGCAAGCIDYPYREIASRFPRDYFWMFPAMLLMLAYLALMVAIAASAPARSRVYAQTGLCFAVIGAAVLIVNYYVQVTVIQPSVLNGETDGVAILTQYNPHGVFIALEEVGYLMVSASFPFVAPVFSRPSGLERLLRVTLIGGFGLAIVALVATAAIYGTGREYWFEIGIITINYAVLLVAGVLSAQWFRRVQRELVAP